MATYYGAPGQLVGYIEGFGVAFIHQQTGTFYAWVERTQQFTTMQGHNYTSYWAPEFYVGNQIPGAMVDYRLPNHVRDLPPALDMPNRFLIASQFAAGPALELGTIYQIQGVPLAKCLDGNNT